MLTVHSQAQQACRRHKPIVALHEAIRWSGVQARGPDVSPCLASQTFQPLLLPAVVLAARAAQSPTAVLAAIRPSWGERCWFHVICQRVPGLIMARGEDASKKSAQEGGRGVSSSGKEEGAGQQRGNPGWQEVGGGVAGQSMANKQGGGAEKKTSRLRCASGRPTRTGGWEKGATAACQAGRSQAHACSGPLPWLARALCFGCGHETACCDYPRCR